MLNIKIKDLILLSKYDLDMLFIIILIKENKSRKLGPQKVKKNIVFTPLDEFFNYLNYVEKDTV